MFKTILTLALVGFTAVQAHMQLEYPPALNALNNPHLSGPGDDEYVYPMGCCGKNNTAICHGYLDLLGTPEGASVATWEAGSTITWNITGAPEITGNSLGGTHWGGSCQVGFSIDGGKTFQVAASYEGNCPHRESARDSGQNFNLTIPEDLPAGDAVFSWTWINREREFNMNCAAVTIVNSKSSSDGDSSSSSIITSTPSSTAATKLSSTTTYASSTHTTVVSSSTKAANTPSSTGTTVNGGAKQISIDWCSCKCDTATQDTNDTTSWDADNCTCQCWKPPTSLSSGSKKPRMARDVRDESEQQQNDGEENGRLVDLDIQQKRAASWYSRPSMLIPSPVWHNCELPLTNAELKYPNPGSEVVQGDGAYPLELPSTVACN